ncbi:MAG: LPD5 domain-containing protein, partial [Candidatus Omnitrophica bacterium]|nr:LPD5 domain-containing protein [Candidatus Omnitrophota bacterium]
NGNTRTLDVSPESEVGQLKLEDEAKYRAKTTPQTPLQEAAKSEEKKGEVKQPWQMTREEYIASPDHEPFAGMSKGASHRSHVTNAYAKGEKIPANVLADYDNITDYQIAKKRFEENPPKSEADFKKELVDRVKALKKDLAEDRKEALKGKAPGKGLSWRTQSRFTQKTNAITAAQNDLANATELYKAHLANYEYQKQRVEELRAKEQELTEPEIKTPINQAAHEASTSPLNEETTPPTPLQESAPSAVTSKGTTDKNGTFISGTLDLVEKAVLMDINRKYFRDNITYALTNSRQALVTDGEHVYSEGKRYKVRPDGTREEYGTDFSGFERKLMSGIADGSLSYNEKAKKLYDEKVAEREANNLRVKAVEEKVLAEAYVDKQDIEDAFKAVTFENGEALVPRRGMEDALVKGKQYKDWLVAKNVDENKKLPWTVYFAGTGQTVAPYHSDGQGFSTQKEAQVFAMRLGNAFGGLEDLREGASEKERIKYAEEIGEALREVKPEVGYSALDYVKAVRDNDVYVNVYEALGKEKPAQEVKTEQISNFDRKIAEQIEETNKSDKVISEIKKIDKDSASFYQIFPNDENDILNKNPLKAFGKNVISYIHKGGEKPKGLISTHPYKVRGENFVRQTYKDTAQKLANRSGSPIAIVRFNDDGGVPIGLATVSLPKIESGVYPAKRYAELAADGIHNNNGSADVFMPKSEQPTQEVKQPVDTESKKAKIQSVKEKHGAVSTKTVEDFGANIGGARKDLMKSYGKVYSDEELINLPLSKIWPLSEVDKIEDGYIAAVASAARQEIPTKPQKGYKVKSWIEKVKFLRSMVTGLLDGSINKEIFQTKLKESNKLNLGGFIEKVELLQHLDRSQWKRIGDVAIHENAYTYVESVKVPKPYTDIQIDGNRVYFEGITKIADVLDRVKEKLGVEEKAKTIKFEVRGYTNDWAIYKTGDSAYHKLKGGFAEVKDARAFIKEHNDELIKAWEDVKNRENVKEKDLRHAENRPRSAQDWRRGKDITEEEFKDTFGFAGGKFGKWVSQGKDDKERQWMLNNAYDALMDLADIVGIKPDAISLEGRLGILFGAGGHGWASAHYDPTNLVINLTKTRGAGALAHEWFHALDNYFQLKRGKGNIYDHSNYITHHPETYYENTKSGHRLPANEFEKSIKKESGYRYLVQNPDEWKKIEGVRPEVADKFVSLVKALDESPMAKRAALLDKGKSKGYWSSKLERAARAFENYVVSKMDSKGYHNDYLANVVNELDFVRDGDRYPYLKKSEIEPVAKAFDALFETIQQQDTDKGTALHSRAANNTVITPFASKQEAVNHLIQNFGPGVKTLFRTGLVNLVETSENFPALAKKYANYEKAEAVFINGKIYIASSNMDKSRYVPVLLHELGEHFNLRRMIGSQAYEALQRQIAILANKAGTQEAKVWADVKRLYPHVEEGSETFVSEVIAKLGETNPELPWYKRLISQIKAFLVKHGLARGFITGKMTGSDMHALLVSSLQSAIKGRTLNEARFYNRDTAMASLPEQIKPEYDITKDVDWVSSYLDENNNNEKKVTIKSATDGKVQLWIDKDGKITDTTVEDFFGENLSSIIGKELADKILSTDKYQNFSGEELGQAKSDEPYKVDSTTMPEVKSQKELKPYTVRQTVSNKKTVWSVM